MKHNVERLAYMVEHPYPNICEQLWETLNDGKLRGHVVYFLLEELGMTWESYYNIYEYYELRLCRRR